jgi:quinol monooxygenase YgiN
MINVVASIRIKEGKMSEFLEIFKANVPNVLAEKGCIEYCPAIDIDADLPPQALDENLVTLIEKWEDLESLKVHLVAPHMLAYREKVKEMVEDLSLRVLQEG